MALPTVLMTDVVRSSNQGDSHGGAYLIDLETQQFEQVLDWNRVDIDWEGRGMGRGLRGICYVNRDVYIAASNELFVFDTDFNILRSFTCPYLHHCHEIAYDGERYIYLSATSFDSILRFDVQEGRFDKGWWIRPVQRVVDGRQQRALFAQVFDPNEPEQVRMADTLHINNVCVHNGIPMFSGLHMNLLVKIENDHASPIAMVPPTTHNCQLLGKGVVMNSTGQDAVVMADRNGKEISRFEYPTYPIESLVGTDVPDDFARQGFGRGLCTDPINKLLIAGSSPGTVSAFHVQSGEQVSSVQVINDLRNAPHGLEIWPF